MSKEDRMGIQFVGNVLVDRHVGDVESQMSEADLG